LITGGVKSWSVVAALQEAGLELAGTSVKKSTREDKERIKELMGQDAHMIEDMTPREMYKMLQDARADITPIWAMSAWSSSWPRSTRRFTIRCGNRCASRRPGTSPATAGKKRPSR